MNDMKPFVRLVVFVLLVALVVWFVTAFLPLPYPFGLIILAVGVGACVVACLKFFGLW